MDVMQARKKKKKGKYHNLLPYDFAFHSSVAKARARLDLQAWIFKTDEFGCANTQKCKKELNYALGLQKNEFLHKGQNYRKFILRCQHCEIVSLKRRCQVPPYA